MVSAAHGQRRRLLAARRQRCRGRERRVARGGRNGSPVAWTKDGRTLAICNSRNGLVAVDLKSGAIAWTAPGGGDSTPAISGDTLAVQVKDSKIGFVAYKLS